MSGASEEPRALWLALLGTRILLRCLSAECCQGIRDHFHPHQVPDLWRTPDFIIECDWPRVGRYLFRARPEVEAQEPLVGVRVRGLGQPTATEWRGAFPPLPPFSLPPLRDKFVGLHAACVAMDSGSVLVLVGPRGAGKTTLATRLVNDVGGQLLADEMTCIHTRSMVVAPFAMAMGVTTLGADGRTRKDPVAADRVVNRIATKAHSITGGIILNPQAVGAPYLRLLSQARAFRLLLSQHLDLGTDLGECLTTLADLTMEVPFLELTYAGYDQIEPALAQLAELALAGPSKSLFLKAAT